MTNATQIVKFLEANYKVMVCDVQPGYSSYIHFNVPALMDFLNESSKVAVFYVGPGFGFGSEQDILYWYYENGLDESTDLTFIEKNYAFFRPWMDQGVV
ncbi:MAG: hypothetical protein B7C24_15350 [Bacteroidetes bacterium 4572_77]|nr:MAG: hypothetical protein B7C24_15350 [Bacteroidetes bacterium 4572_77]